jgi:hypothetical protein
LAEAPVAIRPPTRRRVEKERVSTRAMQFRAAVLASSQTRLSVREHCGIRVFQKVQPSTFTEE